jgi:Flp pilus assembly protein TadB
VNALLLVSLFFSVAAAGGTVGLYQVWPRPMTLEEWVMHRRMVAERGATARRGLAARLAGRTGRVASLRWLVELARADLRLLALRRSSVFAGEDEMVAGLLRRVALGAVGGFATGLLVWLLAGRPGVPVAAVVLGVVASVLLPASSWMRFHRAAAHVRASIERGLPRLLTGSRVLLESGATTPHQALSAAVRAYSDPAADILHEALVDQGARQVELQEALERVARGCALEPLRRLADAYRVGIRHGTQMADLLTGFARDLRHGEHAAYRERMTRAPVLMTLPALVFFVLPLLALVLLLVVAPLEGALSQL